MTDPDPANLRTRTIGRLIIDASDAEIAIEHVYLPEGSFDCDDCGKPGHDPGMIGLVIDGNEETGHASVLMSPEEALLLINRLQRGVSLVMESGEDPADIEREAARFAARPEPQP